jgi:polygalacturonase
MREDMMRRLVMGVISAITLSFLVAQAREAVAERVCEVHKFANESANGSKLDTTAIQNAIDRCASNGGGVVKLAGAERFVSGPLVLKSHITLDIAAGTTLEASSNHDDYPETELFNQTARQGLLSAHDAEDITIRGGGVIDGRGESWWPDHRKPGYLRPRLIVFLHCKHVLMENITVENSPMWQITPYESEDLVFRNMKFYAPNPASHNTDGIDPFSCKHVVIDHVTIDTGDDNVAIKSGLPGSTGNMPSEDITITDCTFLHGHGLSIGSEVAGGVRHVRVERVQFKGTNAGVRIKSGRDRGNDISDFVYQDLTMEDVNTPIEITDYYHDGSAKGVKQVVAATVSPLTPHIHDVTIENVRATGAAVAMEVDGLPEAPIMDLRLENVHIDAAKGATIAYADVVSRGLVIQAQTGPPVTTGAGATTSVK